MAANHENNERAETQEVKTLWNINFILVLILGFLSGTANQMVTPLLSRYAVSLGAPLALAGFIVGLMSGISMLLRPFSGAASDLLNRKRVMVVSGLITATAYAGYLLFSSITAVIICRILQGFSFSFMSVARTTYATEYMPRDRMGEGIAFTSFGLILSQAMGPNIGLWISENWGYRACFFVALLLSLTGSTLLMSRPYTKKKEAFSLSKVKLSNLIAVEVIPYALIAGSFFITLQLGNAFIVLVGAERGIANVGLFFTVFSVCTLILRPLSGRVLDKFGLPVLLYPAIIFASLTMVLIGRASGIVFILLAGLTKSLSHGVAIASIQGACIKKSGKERAGVAAATIHMGQDLLGALAPVIGGLLAANYGYANMYYIFAGVMLLVAPAYMFLRRFESK